MNMRTFNGLTGLPELRRRAGMTQKDLAAVMGVTRECVAMWETGKSWPSASTLPRLADLLLCSIDDLYQFTSREEGAP